jgi:hypothetical protein
MCVWKRERERFKRKCEVGERERETKRERERKRGRGKATNWMYKVEALLLVQPGFTIENIDDMHCSWKQDRGNNGIS